MGRLSRLFHGFRLGKKLKNKNVNIRALALCDENCVFEDNVSVDHFSTLTNTSVGRYTYFAAYFSAHNSKIGRYCSVGSNVYIGLPTHAMDAVSMSPIFQNRKNAFNVYYGGVPEEEPKVTEVGNDVWIGNRAMITGGVKIGNGAIIGAGSIVTKDIPPYAVAAGVPAKVLKYRFTEKQIEKLQELQWWNWSDEKIKNISEKFNDIDRFLLEMENK